MVAQITIGPAGPTPTPPLQLRAQLIARAAQLSPGLTADLPASMIDDISGTDTGALIPMEQMIIDLINSVGPYAANPFILNLLGQAYGVAIGLPTLTSVFVVFSGTPGQVISKGFIVSDTNFQYALADGGIIESDGQTSPLLAVATTSGTWAIAAGTVTKTVTSVPSQYPVTVVNPQPGIPGTDAETQADYRQDVLAASLVAAQGYFTMLQTRLKSVDGVQRRLINAIPQSGGGWEILVGGGDPYAVAYAIYQSTQDISTLVGSILRISGITNANPGVVTTDITHGYAVGQPIQISGTSPSPYNGSYVVLAVPDSHDFSLGTTFGAQQISTLTWAATPDKATVGFAGPHGVTVGSTVVIVGCSPAGYNGTFVVTDVVDANHFKYALTPNPGSSTVLGQLQAGIANVDTTLTSPWVSGGIVTPNLRNLAVTIVDYPNSYVIPYASPPQQTVTMTVTWNTISPNLIAPAAVAQVVAPAIAAYINTITQGGPINELQLDSAFEASTTSIIPVGLLSRLVYSIAIDGAGVSPDAGTREVYGDPQSFLFAQVNGISVVQG